MIVTVTPNPALDLTWHVDRIVAGGTHRADAGAARAGGKGLNVARVAHAQGARVCAVTTFGGATGAEFFAELEASGVPHALTPVNGATRRSIALVDEALGDTTIINERGLPLLDVDWDALRGMMRAALAVDADDAKAAQAAGTGVLVISGSFPPETPDDVLPSLIAIGRDAGVPVIVDTSGPALLVAADAGASVLKPNEHELRDATGLDDPIEGARELIRRGAELVLLSRGAEGMLAITRADDSVGNVRASASDSASRAATRPATPTSSEISDTESPRITVLHARLDTALAGNPTGAGDAAVAACAVLMDAGVHDPAQILRRATAWSAAAVLMPLAGEIHPTWPDLERALVLTPKETR